MNRPVPAWTSLSGMQPVRIVHWLLVLLLAVLLATGLAGDDWLAWHMRAGYAMLTLVLFRILWGFAGSRNARFAAFVRGPRAVRATRGRSRTARTRCTRRTIRSARGWWWRCSRRCCCNAALGLFTNDDVLYEGPLVRHITKDLSDTLSSLHRRWWWVVAALAVVAHRRGGRVLHDAARQPRAADVHRPQAPSRGRRRRVGGNGVDGARHRDPGVCAAGVWWLVTKF